MPRYSDNDPCLDPATGTGRTNPAELRNLLRALVCILALGIGFSSPTGIFCGLLVAQTNTEVTELEAARLASAVFAGLERTGDVRKLDQRVFSPAPFKAVCEVLFLIPEPLCAQVPEAERREYAFSSINILWNVLEHQMALPNPLWLQDPANVPNDPAEFFPEEVRSLVAATKMKQPGDLADFRRRLAAGIELEKALMEHRLKHKHVDEPSYRTNLKRLEDKFDAGSGEGRIARLDEDPGSTAVNIFSYVKFPFVFFIVKDQGIARIVWFRGATD